jgi:hypothetical protein
MCSTQPPTKSDKLLHFAVFLDTDIQKFSSRKVEEVLRRIRESSISRLLEIEISPVNIHIELHPLGGVSVTEERFCGCGNKVLEDRRDKYHHPEEDLF